MKTRLGVSLCLALALTAVVPAQPPPPVVVAGDSPLRTAQQLDQLLGPIALYPDALIALLLPAAAAPVDLVLAARYLNDGGDPNATGSRAWDESVKSLAHYPDVVKWMDENIEWTKQVGEAFLAQPADVMQSVQRLRAIARAAGTLADTPQQLVGLDGDVITIVPAQPNVIYVPRYSPEIVYVTQPAYYSSYAQPFLTFGVGFAVGPWLTHDCDWRAHRIWAVNRQWNWRDHRDWRRPTFPGQPGYVASAYRQPWTPPANVVRPPFSAGRRGREFNRPTPMVGTPVPTFAGQSATQIQTTTTTTTTVQPARRDRNTPGRRADVVAAQPAPQGPQPAQPTPTIAPPINMRGRSDGSAPGRRVQPNPAVATNRPAPNTTAVPQPAYAAATTPERRYPLNPAPSTAVVAPITGPLVSPMAPPSSPHPRIAFPAASNNAPASATRSTPAPAAHRAPPPAQPQPQPAPPSRDDKENRRKVDP